MKGPTVHPENHYDKVDERQVALADRKQQLENIKARVVAICLDSDPGNAVKAKLNLDDTTKAKFEQLKFALAKGDVKFVKDIDFMTLVEGITDQYSNTSSQDSDTFTDSKTIQETTTFKREIIAPNNDKNNFVEIYNWYKGNGKVGVEEVKEEESSAVTDPPGGLEKWQALFLGEKLDELCLGNENKIKELHIPAMFRYFGATNLRADVTTLSYQGSENNKYDIKVVSAPHGSHVPLKSSLSNDEKIEIAKKSIESLSKSAISDYLKDEKNEYLGDVDLKQDIYLTTFVSDINIMDRDTKVIDMTRKAATEAKIDKITAYYNNIAIQSGFAMFEDYNLKENKDFTENINKKTTDVIDKLKAAKERGDEKKIGKRIELLEKVNTEYNKAIDARLSQHQYSNIVFNSLAAISILSLVALGVFAPAPLITVLAISGTFLFSGAVLNTLYKRYDGSGVFSARNNFYYASILAAGVMAALFVGTTFITLPFSLPLLGAVAIAAAAVALTAIAFDFRANRFPANANNTYVAALQSINVGLNFDISDIGCQEGKDRTGAVLIMKNAILKFQQEHNGDMPNMQDRSYLTSVGLAVAVVAGASLLAMVGFSLPVTGPAFIAVAAVGVVFTAATFLFKQFFPIPKSSDIKEMAKITSDIIKTGHDAKMSARNTVGGRGIKHGDAYLPKSIVSNLSDDAKVEMKSWKENVKWFGPSGVETTLKAAALQEKPGDAQVQMVNVGGENEASKGNGDNLSLKQ